VRLHTLFPKPIALYGVVVTKVQDPTVSKMELLDSNNKELMKYTVKAFLRNSSPVGYSKTGFVLLLCYYRMIMK